MRPRARLLLWIAAGLSAAPAAAETVAITNVAVLSMASDRVMAGRTVIVTDGTITRISSKAAVPKGAIRIDGSGRFLVPAFADMHVHLLRYVKRQRPTMPLKTEPEILGADIQCAVRNELYLYLAFGVTTVRAMDGIPAMLDWADKVERQVVDGPRIHVATPILDGDPPANPNGTAIAIGRAEDVPAIMAMLRATKVGGKRYEFVKVYEQMPADVYAAIVIEAARYGIPVVGHVPFAVPTEVAIDSGQRSIEHLRGYEVDIAKVPTTSIAVDRWLGWHAVSDARMQALAKRTAGKDIWNVATLAVNQDGMDGTALALLDGPAGAAGLVSDLLMASLRGPVFPPAVAEAIHAAEVSTLGQQRKMIRALAANGAKLMAGTDTPLLGNVPGQALHREMELLVEAGLTPFQALRAAIWEPQRFLGDAKAGFIATGARSDLVLLDANPLLDIRNTRRIAGVLVRGRWWSSDALSQALHKTRNASSPDCLAN